MADLQALKPKMSDDRDVRKVLLRRPLACPRPPPPPLDFSDNVTVPPSSPDEELSHEYTIPKSGAKSRGTASTVRSGKRDPPPSQMTMSSPIKPAIIAHPIKHRIPTEHTSNRATVASGSSYSRNISPASQILLKVRGPDNFPIPAAKVWRVVKTLELEPSPSESIYARNRHRPSPAVIKFVEAFAKLEHVLPSKVESIVYSRQNFRQLTKLVAEMLNGPRQTEVATKDMAASIPADDMPHPPSEVAVTGSRIPQRQLLIEMAQTLTQEMRALTHNPNVCAAVKTEKKYNPHRPVDEVPALEFAFYQTKPLPVSEDEFTQRIKDSRVLVQTSSETHFMDSRRTHSPFVDSQGAIHPADMALFESLIDGGAVLSLKAHFIDFLPDISPLFMTLRYINLSFNNFSVIPPEVCLLVNLEVLKLRNNPIKEIPENIALLKNLKTFEISFCLLGEIPSSVFSLHKLQYLDVSYNKLVSLPSDIRKLKNLQVLFLEGNQLAALPCSTLVLPNLRYIRVRNNFMHPIFWADHTKNDSPQRLVDLASLTFMQLSLNKRYGELPDLAKSALSRCYKCDCCKGPMFGPGLTLIRPGGMFGVKNVPFMFHSCSHYCAQVFMTSSDSLSEILFEDDEDDYEE